MVIWDPYDPDFDLLFKSYCEFEKFRYIHIMRSHKNLNQIHFVLTLLININKKVAYGFKFCDVLTIFKLYKDNLFVM